MIHIYPDFNQLLQLDRDFPRIYRLYQGGDEQMEDIKATDKGARVNLVYAGGTGLRDAYRLLAKKVKEEMQKKEQENARGGIYKSINR